ncbi:putative Zn(II)2Cys6 transcription factor [Plectosphaerella plurivora]|uniref:Zn(II)2Cys6 transcription factor n=1 Tax=Plectosphaerella plurivora TaxID=936078 RepID=A0A9P8V2R4_9PEZI|nr:putative Zn(II)2Cys6 transcription factor [Plectosphaerella plurivora]
MSSSFSPPAVGAGGGAPAASASSASPAASSSHPDKRRKFTIQSDFGQARGFRSRKSRPCDTCRKRKTACKIDTAPPCDFCKLRGLQCKSSGTVGSYVDGPASSSISTPTSAIKDEASPGTAVSTPAFKEETASITTASTPAASPASIARLPGIESVSSRYLSSRPPSAHHGSPDTEMTHGMSPVYHLLNHPHPHQPYHQAPTPSAAAASSPAPSSSGPSSSMGAPPPIRTLEDAPGRTSHSMGPAAEQDALLLDSFRSVIMNGHEIDAEFVQVFPGTSPSSHHGPARPPVHFCFIVDEFFPHDDRVKNECSDAIEALAAPHADALVRAYFRHVHPVLPVVSKGRFLRRYVDDRRQMPASLRGAVYALACLFWDREPSLPGSRAPYNQHELADLALTSLQRELDSPNLDKMQASILLLHLKPNDVDSVEHPRTWTQTAQAVACAQMIGLHQDPDQWSIPSWEKKLRKKLWWATFAADVWSSLCHGNPPHVYPSSFSTSPLTTDDMWFDEEVASDLQRFVDQDASAHLFIGARFVEHVKMAVLARDVLATAFEVPQTNTSSSAYRPHRDLDHLYNLRTNLKRWQSMVPHCLGMPPAPQHQLLPSPVGLPPASSSNNAPLHLSYYATQTLVYRALMSPATKAARADPSSNLRRYFRDARVEFSGFATFMTQVGGADLNGFWGRHGRSQLILCGNFLVYLFLLAHERDDVQAAFRLIESFHESLARLETLADSTARLLIRPVALRMNSFFVQAPDLMRNPAPGAEMSTPDSYTT